MGFKKLMVAAALTAAVVATPVAGASAEPYSPNVLPTNTHITVVADGPGKPTEITVWSTANSATPPEGDIKVTLSSGASVARGSRALGGAPVLTRTVHFVDAPVTFTGPSLPAGTYLGKAALTPSDPTKFLPSDGSTTLRLTVGGETDPEDDGNGGLPNTGGPNMMWLLLGGALVAGGASSVAYARRRQPVTI